MSTKVADACNVCLVAAGTAMRKGTHKTKVRPGLLPESPCVQKA